MIFTTHSFKTKLHSQYSTVFVTKIYVLAAENDGDSEYAISFVGYCRLQKQTTKMWKLPQWRSYFYRAAAALACAARGAGDVRPWFELISHRTCYSGHFWKGGCHPGGLDCRKKSALCDVCCDFHVRSNLPCKPKFSIRICISTFVRARGPRSSETNRTRSDSQHSPY